MAWRKSPPELIALFDEVAPGDPIAERRQMFGYPCAFVNGNMFIGLHQEDMVLRLSEADRAAMKSEHGAGAFEPTPGRAMKEYVSLPRAILEDRPALDDWIGRSLDYAGSLPRKVKKKRKKKA